MARTAAIAAIVMATLAGGLATSAAATDEPVIETLTVPELDAWALSPDGTLVAGVRGDVQNPDEWCLHELPSGTERWCIDAAPGSEPLVIGPNWLPDGSAFVATESLLGEPDVWRIDAATGEATDLTDDGYAGRWRDLRATIGPGDPPLHLDIYPVVSPDGTSVAFLRSTTTDTAESSVSLQLVPVAGGSARELATLPTMLSRWPAWSKDGQWVHWVEDGDRGGDVIGSVALDGSPGRRIHLSDPDGGDLLPSRIRATLADGRLLMDAQCELFGDCHTWLVDPVTGIAETLLAESEDDPSLVILAVTGSRDGRRVVALLRRGEAVQVEVIDPTTRQTRAIPLPGFDATRSTGIRWLTEDRILVGGDELHPRDHLVISLPAAWDPGG